MSEKGSEQAPEPKPKKAFEGQHDNEVVHLAFHQHPIVMRKALMVGLIVLLVSALPLAFIIAVWPWWVLLTGFIIMMGILTYRWIGWYYSVFIVTNERLIQIKQKGFFDRRVTDISHSKIQSVNYEIKGMAATMLHYGTIIVQTYVGDLVLRFIHHPADVQQLLVKNIRSVKPVDVAEVQGDGEA
jgi:hypothetical protein